MRSILALYVLFAAMGGSGRALVVESVVMTVFVLVAVLGFTFSSWLIAAALAAHGLFDLFHPFVMRNPGVPEWWPAFCMTFDVGAAGLLALFLVTRRVDHRVANRRSPVCFAQRGSTLQALR